MGWCSGTEIFDRMVEIILYSSATIEEKEDVITELIKALEDQDWDCQEESDFYNNPQVKRAFYRVHPEWFQFIGN